VFARYHRGHNFGQNVLLDRLGLRRVHDRRLHVRQPMRQSLNFLLVLAPLSVPIPVDLRRRRRRSQRVCLVRYVRSVVLPTRSRTSRPSCSLQISSMQRTHLVTDLQILLEIIEMRMPTASRGQHEGHILEWEGELGLMYNKKLIEGETGGKVHYCLYYHRPDDTLLRHALLACMEQLRLPSSASSACLMSFASHLRITLIATGSNVF